MGQAQGLVLKVVRSAFLFTLTGKLSSPTHMAHVSLSSEVSCI